MAKYFLGSVGEAEAYQVTTDSLTGESTMDLIFTSHTMTDSAVNISINKEQIIDSYNGAPAGVFYHSPSVNITLSDILWNPRFLEASLGQKFNQLCDDGNIEFYQTELTANSQGVVQIPSSKRYPIAIDLPSSGEGTPYVVIGKLQGDTEWYDFPYDPQTHTIGYYNDEDPVYSPTKQGCLIAGATYCFKYPISSMQSRLLTVTTQIVPDELFLVITTPIFVADSYSLNPIDSEFGGEYTAVSTGKRVGKIIYEVPRWVLDSDLSFNFAMSGTANMQLTGTVMESIDNEQEPTFMRLREFIKTRVWYEGLVDLVTNETASSVADVANADIYGIYADGSFEKITSTRDNIRLIYRPNGTSTSPANSIYTYDNVNYNVTGQFTSISGTTAVRVIPAVVWLDENENETFLILDDISCTIPYNG